MFTYIWQIRCQRGLNSIKRVSKLFNFLLSSKKFIDPYPKCSDANYPAFKYTKNTEPICCLGKLYSMYHSTDIIPHINLNSYGPPYYISSIPRLYSLIRLGVPNYVRYYSKSRHLWFDSLHHLPEEVAFELFKEMLLEKPKSVYDRLFVLIKVLKKYYPDIHKILCGQKIEINLE